MISFLQNWNNFLFPLIVVNTTNMNVISEGLSVFSGQFNINYNLIMSAALIAITPNTRSCHRRPAPDSRRHHPRCHPLSPSNACHIEA